MNRHTLLRLARLATLLFLVSGVLLLGTYSAAWATPAQAPTGQSIQNPRPCVGQPRTSPPRAIQVPVGPGIDVVLANCPWSMIITGDDFSFFGTLEIAPPQSSAAPPANVGEILLGPRANITLFDASGNPFPNPIFANPVLLCFAYTADELAQAGNNPANLIVEFFDTQTSTWVGLPTFPDPPGQVCAAVTHLTLFSLAARGPVSQGAPPITGAPVGPVPSALPNTGTPQASALVVWLWALIALAITAGIAFGWYARRLGRGQLAPIASAIAAPEQTEGRTPTASAHPTAEQPDPSGDS